MSSDFAALRERQIQNLTNFLNTEVELGITFARIAKYQLGRGNMERYEASKRNAIAALVSIDHFKRWLPSDIRTKIESRRPELAQLISTL